jgi:hypothetical protein
MSTILSKYQATYISILIYRRFDSRSSHRESGKQQKLRGCMIESTDNFGQQIGRDDLPRLREPRVEKNLQKNGVEE